VADLAVGPTLLPASNLLAADLAVGPTLLPASNLQVVDLAVGPTSLPASHLPAADLAVGLTPLPASNLQAADLAVGPPLSAASQQPPSGRPCGRFAPSAASQLPLRSSSTLHCGGFRFPLWVTCSSSVCRHRDWGLAKQRQPRAEGQHEN